MNEKNERLKVSKSKIDIRDTSFKLVFELSPLNAVSLLELQIPV